MWWVSMVMGFDGGYDIPIPSPPCPGCLLEPPRPPSLTSAHTFRPTHTHTHAHTHTHTLNTHSTHSPHTQPEPCAVSCLSRSHQQRPELRPPREGFVMKWTAQ